MGRGNRKFSQRTQGGREARYGLTGVPKGTLIALCTDKYRRWTPETTRTGVILKRVSQTCWVRWDDDPETIVAYPEGDIRYWVDTNKARLTSPPGRTILDAKGSA